MWKKRGEISLKNFTYRYAWSALSVCDRLPNIFFFRGAKWLPSNQTLANSIHTLDSIEEERIVLLIRICFFFIFCIFLFLSAFWVKQQVTESRHFFTISISPSLSFFSSSPLLVWSSFSSLSWTIIFLLYLIPLDISFPRRNGTE